MELVFPILRSTYYVGPSYEAGASAYQVDGKVHI